jgi:predicted metal-binding membrane protein
MMWPRVDARRPFVVLVLTLVALAWLALVVWGQSPYARYLSHHELGDLALGGSGEAVGITLLFVLGWTVMTTAMMLPTSLPLFALFQRLVRPRPDAPRLVALLIAGYLTIWTAFGVAAHIGDRGIHALVEHVPWLAENAWVLGAGVLLLAGLYQFSSLKYLCLEKCRSPLSFITEHWHGRHERAEAFRLGVHHGLFCVGCCWSLMLVMFAVGVGNVAWMLALSVVMAVEKNMPWGRRISAPLGGVLVASALAATLLSARVACAHPGVC